MYYFVLYVICSIPHIWSVIITYDQNYLMRFLMQHGFDMKLPGESNLSIRGLKLL